MAYDVYSTAFLLGAYGIMDRPKSFILDTFFKNEIQFETEQVFFDKVERARRLAPLVIPTVAGVPEKLRGYATNSYTPAYVKAKHAIEPSKLLKRRPGESLNGDMSFEQRRESIVLDTLMIQDDQITRREEVMAISLMLTGSVTVQGPNFPTSIVDMGRPAGNTVVLSGATAWGQSGVDPLDDLNAWSSYTQKVSGFAPNTVVMDPVAFEKFRRSAGVAQVMNSFRQLSGNVDLAGTAVGGNGNFARKVAEFAQFEIWVYQQYYTDDNGVVTQFLPDNTVIMASEEGCQGTRLYGAIQDMRAPIALSRFPKMWISEDPSMEILLTQSAPLMVTGWSEATFCATVA
jgi:hypothetical protein